MSVLSFSSGVRVVYKPKDVGLEVAFGNFVEWFNQRAELPLRVPRVVDRGAYGWAEHIARAPCSDLAAVRRFYRRAGALLCLMYLLGGVDGHAGNWVVDGEHLVMVDMETLMYPVFAGGTRDGAPDSVLRTGLIPTGIEPDMSGLGFSGVRAKPRRVWRYVDTDDIHFGWDPEPPPERCVPVLNGAMVCPHDHAQELLDGFERTYRDMLARRDELLAADGPLATLAGRQVRFAHRNTGGYLAVIESSLEPAPLRCGVDWGIELERLARAFTESPSLPLAWPLLAAELQAVERLDIPFFAAISDRDELSVGLARPLQCFVGSGHARVRERVRRLDEVDRTHQRSTIEAAVRRPSGG